ncbi:hypothetical protein [Sphingomonas qomolangmaensis]|uniref:Pycsar effector protein domain-containing protein n=1 Tax=Sphingomonas qomolangmaensis TaxID=2918765 RepID=A0ABY5L9Q6_9SPHN|nr:hypothetical protein [Sphingomonas qomolangmaensis]UUL82534.1 hypothetical protein NMP03_15405 [Sphingomonas qomolangmaensis]
MSEAEQTNQEAEAPVSTKDQASKPLSPIKAIYHALLGHEIDHYPRVLEGGEPRLLHTDALMREFVDAAAHWTCLPATEDVDKDRLDDAIKLARQSLDEVKDQTEYQDQKATRLLTVTTFLTAFSGVLFARMLDAYPRSSFAAQPLRSQLLLGASYVLFGAFVLSAVFGALITFHATRTRFKYVHDGEVSRDDGLPRSRLFYRGILRVRPKAWALTFVTPHAGSEQNVDPVLDPALKQAYFRDLVGETYLIAAKAADKLRFLDPAQRLLATSLTCLFFWLTSLVIVGIGVTPPPAKPMVIHVDSSGAPIEIKPVSSASEAPAPPATPQVSPTGKAAPPPPSKFTEPLAFPQNTVAPKHNAKKGAPHD